jgi:nucleotide-binding universal stress UspA family protein
MSNAMKAERVGEGTDLLTPFSNGVLMGISLGASDEQLLSYLSFLAEHFNIGILRCLHVIPDRNRNDEEGAGGLSGPDNYPSAEKTASDLPEMMVKFLPSSLKIETKVEVRRGDLLQEFLNSAKSSRTDLLVLGRSDRKERHSSLARNLVRQLTCDALIVPNHAPKRMKHILVPVDFSPNSLAALKKALDWQRHFSPPPVITVLNTYEMPPFPSYLIRKTREEIIEMLLNDRTQALQSFIRSTVPHDLRSGVRIEIEAQEQGSIGELIMAYAGKERCDLIVMGAKGHSRASLLLLGSVTEEVLNLTSQAPVLVVKQNP